MAYLEIESGELAGRRFELAGDTVIGRSSSAALNIPHPSISRKHAGLSLNADGRWVVTDLDSRNGTTVNGKAIKQHVLHDGDTISVGELALRFGDETKTDSTDSAEEDLPGFTLSTLRPEQRPRVSSEHVAAILGFGGSLQGIADAPQRLDALLRLAVRQEVGGWWAHALRVSKLGDELQIRALADPVASPFGMRREPHISKSVLRAVLRDGAPVVGNNLAKKQPFQAEMTFSPETAKVSAVACPFGNEGAAIDVLYVTLPLDLGTVEWLMLLSLAVEQYRHANAAWAARSAAEIRAALDREMDLARRVQARTLPRHEQAQRGALDWAVRFDPCLSVAGDYVDVVARDDGSMLLLVADAAGKGMQAALITAGLHAIFHTQGRSGSSLPQVVVAADRYLKTFLPETSFVTFTAILLDPRSGEGRCVNCGHPPILAADAAGQVRWIEGGDNLPLGLCEGDVVDLPVTIAPGEWLFAYTDGLTEMFDEAGEMLGLERLRDQFKSICGEPDTSAASELIEKLMTWLDDFRGSATIGDDRTLLVARRV